MNRDSLRAWDRAALAFLADPNGWLTYLDLAIRCHLAGFASPMTVAFGGRA